MEAYFFRPDVMGKLYNCSSRTPGEWETLANPNIFLGILYAGMGVIYLVTYLPFVIAIAFSDLTKYSCYKIMLFLGCIDIICIPIGGLFSGYFAYKGMIYCMAPDLNYIIGSMALGCWSSGSITVFLLGFNRCIDFANPDLASQLFSGKRTYFWLLIPTGLSIYFFFFHCTIPFNSNFYAFFFDPFVGLPERNGQIDNINYPPDVLSSYNVFIVIALSIVYIGLCVSLVIKTRKSQTISMSKIQRQTFIQAMIICTVSFVAALIYAYMQFFPPPLYVIIIGQISWLSSHGCVGLVYATFNPTLRKHVRALFCGKNAVHISTISQVGTTPHKHLSHSDSMIF